MFRIRTYHFSFLVLLVGLLLSAATSPIWYDDAGHFLVIDQALRTGTLAYPSFTGPDPNSPFITLGSPLNHVYWGAMELFGGGMRTARLLTVAFTLLAMLGFWQWARTVMGDKKASWSLWLLLGNIQLLGYGAQLLGELPMLAGVFWGLWAASRWRTSGKWPWLLFWALAWWWAVNCKAYIAVPLGLTLLGLCGVEWMKKEWKGLGGSVVTGLLLGILVGGGLLIEQGGWTELMAWFAERRSYGSEFLAFAPVEALRYLLFKPLFWLGLVALLLRWRFHPRPLDRLPALFQAALLLLFLLSAGYDRFGFQLLFVAALYVSEFCAALWERWQGKWHLRSGFMLVFLLLFVQQSPLILGKRLVHHSKINEQERAVADWCRAHPGGQLYTYDQQLYPFIGPGLALAAKVPSASSQCEAFPFVAGDLLLAGPYAYTEYQDCIPWAAFEERGRFGTPELDGYRILEYRQ